MDGNIESPISFELGDELFPLPSLSFIDISVPQLPSEKNDDSGLISKEPKHGHRRKPPAFSSDNVVDNESPNEHKKKKIIHRDIERQRRQEMSTLYATLRSLLPLEYLKGKRSICDHMHETVKYIVYMKSKIQELSDKRDELKRIFGDDGSDACNVETLHASQRDSVVVRPRNGGVQVVLDTATQHRLPVSNILQALMAERLEIVSCISTQINDRFLHTIESQVVDTIDSSDLQHKLSNLEYFPVD